MITITARPAKLGTGMNNRTEMHGDESTPAADIAVNGLMLSPEELNALLGDQHADRALFNDDRGVKRPIFRCLKPFRLTEKFKGARVTFVLSVLNDNSSPIVLKDCKLSRITLQPCEGGLTMVSLMVQGLPTEDQNGRLFGHLNREITIEIAGGERLEKTKGKGPKRKDENQGELPIGHSPGTDDDAGDDPDAGN